MIDDNPGDIRLVKEALQDSPIRYILHSVHNGEDALRYLRQNQEGEFFAKPDLILLDLNLPKKNGSQVLEEIKQDKRIWDIPVIILSSSRSKNDIDLMYQLGAHSYIPKPESLENFAGLVQEIEKFRMNLPSLPSD